MQVQVGPELSQKYSMEQDNVQQVGGWVGGATMGELEDQILGYGRGGVFAGAPMNVSCLNGMSSAAALRLQVVSITNVLTYDQAWFNEGEPARESWSVSAQHWKDCKVGCSLLLSLTAQPNCLLHHPCHGSPLQCAAASRRPLAPTRPWWTRPTGARAATFAGGSSSPRRWGQGWAGLGRASVAPGLDVRSMLLHPLSCTPRLHAGLHGSAPLFSSLLQDVWGRFEREHAATASNLFKASGGRGGGVG